MIRFLCFLLALAVVARAQEIKTELDVEYGKANGKALMLDIYRPAAKAEKPRAALILVHGGGWILGNKRDFKSEGELAAKVGFVAISVGYRLVFGEEGRWPQPLDDVQRAVRWVRANAERYDIDPERLGAVGASAGGHLAAFLGTMDTRDNSDPALAKYSSRVKCVIDLFGPSDLNQDFSTQVPLGFQANELVQKFLGSTPAEKPELAKEASPLYHVNGKSAPFLILHGKKDRLVPVAQSEVLHAALKKAGVEAKLIIFPDEDHGLNKPANQQAFRKEMVEFLGRHLK